MGPGDYEAMSNDMYLFDIPGRFSHGMSSADVDPVIVDILDWVTTKPVDDFNKILNPLIERYGDGYRVQHYNDAAGDGIGIAQFLLILHYALFADLGGAYTAGKTSYVTHIFFDRRFAPFLFS